jgi:hypothetical protein
MHVARKDRRLRARTPAEDDRTGESTGQEFATIHLATSILRAKAEGLG